MKSTHNRLRLAAILFALPLASHAAPGAYVGVDAGANWQRTQKMYQAGFNFVNLELEKPFDSGTVLAIKAGYAFPSGVRAELELAERSNDMETFTARAYDGGGSLDASGKETARSLFANAWYDFAPQAAVFNVRPYVGAGVGRTRVKVHDMQAGGVSFGSADAWVNAVQVGAGVIVPLQANLGLSIDYRFLRTQSGNFGSIRNIPPGDVHTRYSANSLSLGLQYAF